MDIKQLTAATQVKTEFYKVFLAGLLGFALLSCERVKLQLNWAEWRLWFLDCWFLLGVHDV